MTLHKLKMKITPHSPWYTRKQKLGEFMFTERVKEVPSMVLNGHEVREGIMLVKDLPDSEGAIVKEYEGDYKTSIMAEINPKELHAIILKKIPHDVGFQYLLGLRVYGPSDGALHPAQIAYDGDSRFLLLGLSNPTDYNAREGHTLHILSQHIKRKKKNGKVLYELDSLDPVKISPPGMGSSVGELDNLVEEMIEVDSKFNIGDLLYSPQYNEGESIGQLVNVMDITGEEIATIFWENGTEEEVPLALFELAKDKFSPERLDNAERTIFSEFMMLETEEGHSFGLLGRPVEKGEMFLTSHSDGHFHSWTFGEESTSNDDGHSHKIDLEKGLALEADGHQHNLTLMHPL